MQELSTQLDKLIEDSNRKAAQLESKEIVIQNKKCDHLPRLNELRDKIAECDDEMTKLEAQINEYVNGDKEKVMRALRMEQRKEERLLAKLQQRLNFDERTSMQEIIDKVKEADKDIKETQKEIRLLRRLQHHQGNRLVDITNPNTFPQKIQSLIEERKFQADKNKDLMLKLEHEKRHMEKQNSILDNNEVLLEDIKNELLPTTQKDI